MPEETSIKLPRDEQSKEVARLQAELKHINQLVEHVLLTSSNIIYFYNFEDKKHSITGRTTGTFLGYPLERLADMQNEELQACLHPEELDRIRSHYESCQKAKDGDVLEIEFRMRHRSGEWHWIAVRDTPSERSPAGEATQVFGIAEDITVSRLTQEKIWYLTTHDSLTGLYNRAFYQEELTRLERGRRFPVTVMIADLDGLKNVNDTRGYAAGDTLIRNTAEILVACFRVEDVVARIGGDEFGALLPDIASISIDAIQMRINRRIDIYNQSHPNSPVQISIGIASAENGGVLRETVREADRRMVSVKMSKRGKNPGQATDKPRADA